MVHVAIPEMVYIDLTVADAVSADLNYPEHDPFLKVQGSLERPLTHLSTNCATIKIKHFLTNIIFTGGTQLLVPTWNTCTLTRNRLGRVNIAYR